MVEGARLESVYTVKGIKGSNPFLSAKRRIIKFKRQHELILCNKKITNDYFSSKAYYFYYYLLKLESNFKYLEIGFYEGNSALLVSNLFIRSQIHCVDNWVGTAEYNNHNFLKIEENFDYNTRNKNNILKTKNKRIQVIIFLIKTRLFSTLSI